VLRVAGKDALPASIRLASGFQLWRLNQLGVLNLDGVREITAEQAGERIAAELAAYGLERFPRAGESWPERKAA
jgi:hypothetical protein